MKKLLLVLFTSLVVKITKCTCIYIDFMEILLNLIKNTYDTPKFLTTSSAGSNWSQFSSNRQSQRCNVNVPHRLPEMKIL